MYRVCGLRLTPNFGVWLRDEKNFYLWLTVDKMRTNYIEEISIKNDAKEMKDY